MENVLRAILPEVIKRCASVFSTLTVSAYICRSLGDSKRYMLLSSLLTESKIPPSVIECISLSLLEHATSEEEKNRTECTDLLSAVYQRDSKLIQTLLKQKLFASAGGQRAVDQLLLRLSLVRRIVSSHH